MSSSSSFAPLILILLRGLGLMPMRSTVGLECRLEFARCMSIVLDLLRVVEVVADRYCMLKDTFDDYCA